jgi:hypothetical protein
MPRLPSSSDLMYDSNGLVQPLLQAASGIVQGINGFSDRARRKDEDAAAAGTYTGEDPRLQRISQDAAEKRSQSREMSGLQMLAAKLGLANQGFDPSQGQDPTMSSAAARAQRKRAADEAADASRARKDAMDTAFNYGVQPRAEYVTPLSSEEIMANDMASRGAEKRKRDQEASGLNALVAKLRLAEIGFDPTAGEAGIPEFTKNQAARRDQKDKQAADNAARQIQLTQAQIDNMKADNARQSLGQLGTGVNETVKRGLEALKLMGGGRGSREHIDGIMNRVHAIDSDSDLAGIENGLATVVVDSSGKKIIEASPGKEVEFARFKLKRRREAGLFKDIATEAPTPEAAATDPVSPLLRQIVGQGAAPKPKPKPRTFTYEQLQEYARQNRMTEEMASSHLMQSGMTPEH